MLNVLQKFPGSQCWVSFQCRDSGHTAKGEPFDAVVRELISHYCYPSKLLAIGVNCVRPR